VLKIPFLARILAEKSSFWICRKKGRFSYILMTLLWLCYGFAMALPWSIVE
jgi:hypothetical protein